MRRPQYSLTTLLWLMVLVGLPALLVLCAAVAPRVVKHFLWPPRNIVQGVEASGRVTFNGSPVRDVMVTFIGINGDFTGLTDETGSFDLGMDLPGKRMAIVAPGKYSVYVIPKNAIAGWPKKYSSHYDTPLELEISKSGRNHFDLNVNGD